MKWLIALYLVAIVAANLLVAAFGPSVAVANAFLFIGLDLTARDRLLIPFAGAGSEMIGALLAGWEEIVGVEREADHCRIAEARLAYWQQRRHEFLDPSKPIAASLGDVPDGQLELF